MVYLKVCLEYCVVVGKKASERKIAWVTLGFVETKHNQTAAQPRGMIHHKLCRHRSLHSWAGKRFAAAV